MNHLESQWEGLGVTERRTLKSGARRAPNRSEGFRAGFWIPKKPFWECPRPFVKMQKITSPQKAPGGDFRKRHGDFWKRHGIFWNFLEAPGPLWEIPLPPYPP